MLAYLDDKQRRNSRIALFAKVSIITNAVISLGKIGMSIYSLSFFLFVNGLYNVGIGAAKFIAVKGYGRKVEKTAQEQTGYRDYRLVGVVIAMASAAYMAYSLRMIGGGKSNIQYNLITALAIAAFAFAEIGVSVYGVVKIRRDKEPAMEAIKMTNLVASLISIVLTQSALLEINHVDNIARYCGYTGLIFGGLSAAIGIRMAFRMKGGSALSKEQGR
jgi:divalent metal cation (Fe/Co/Zn/Cd) transporter